MKSIPLAQVTLKNSVNDTGASEQLQLLRALPDAELTAHDQVSNLTQTSILIRRD